ncbi:MAG TPA: hypothetical protein PL009_02235 [Flavipsychrobacter sp.]|nr:hypothetical protein [Flavipsychrobacter sp.]
MKPLLAILLTLAAILIYDVSYGQKKNTIKPQVSNRDTVNIPVSQRQLFVSPKRNLLVTHFDATIGASKVMKSDASSELGFSAAVKGLYNFTGALYVNMGVGISQLSSKPQTDQVNASGKHSATAVTLPFGVGFSIGDDRAQIVNGIDLFPVYYVAHPNVKNARNFTWGFGVDLGFHLRIRERLHLGMMAKLQMFQPFDKDEHQSFPRYGFIGTGLLLRYD